MKREVNRRWIRVCLAGAVAFVPQGCGIFNGSDDDGGSETTGEGDSGSDDAPDPPSDGFRVFPKYLLQDVPAVVTIDDGPVAVPCPVDDIEGGYVCDATEVADAIATIRVEREGFESTVRRPPIVFGQISALEVHLAVEGGPPGTWSDCALTGTFQTCDEVCEAQELTCAPTSCATEDDEWPLATHQTFAAADCLDEPGESPAAACAMDLPIAGQGVESVRCCCAE